MEKPHPAPPINKPEEEKKSITSRNVFTMNHVRTSAGYVKSDPSADSVSLQKDDLDPEQQTAY